MQRQACGQGRLRITVESILDYLSAGETAEEILRQHPMLEPEDGTTSIWLSSRAHALNGHPRACPEDPALRGGQAGKQGRHRATSD
jgi:hypothetical protein